MSGTEKERELAMKSFGTLEIKDASKGEVEAIIATLNVVDRDHEVILPGAIPDGTPVKLSAYGHDAMFGSAPVGKGALFTKGDKVHFKGSFFLETTRGAEAFATAKAIGADQEWSFGFRVLEAMNATEEWAKQGAFRLLKSLQAFEVSPVIIGAGLGTATLALKAASGGTPDPEADAKAAADAAAAEQATQEAEARAAAEVEAKEAAYQAQLRRAGQEEYERFQRNLRRFSSR